MPTSKTNNQVIQFTTNTPVKKGDIIVHPKGTGYHVVIKDHVTDGVPPVAGASNDLIHWSVQ